MDILSDAQFWTYYSTFSRMTKTIPQMLTELEKLSLTDFENNWNEIREVLLNAFNVKVFESMSDFLIEKARPLGNQSIKVGERKENVSIFGLMLKKFQGKENAGLGRMKISIDNDGSYRRKFESHEGTLVSLYTKDMDYADVIRYAYPFPIISSDKWVSGADRRVENQQGWKGFEDIISAYVQEFERRRTVFSGLTTPDDIKDFEKNLKTYRVIKNIIDFRSLDCIGALGLVGNAIKWQEENESREDLREPIFINLKNACTRIISMNINLVDITMELISDREGDRLLNLPNASELNKKETFLYKLILESTSFDNYPKDISPTCFNIIKNYYEENHDQIDLAKYYGGKTLLHIAVEREFPSVVNLLLNNGVNPLLLDDQYETAIEKATSKNIGDENGSTKNEIILNLFDKFYKEQLAIKRIEFSEIESSKLTPKERRLVLFDKQQYAFTLGMNYWYYYQEEEKRLSVIYNESLKEIINYFAEAIEDTPYLDKAFLNLMSIFNECKGNAAFDSDFLNILDKSKRSLDWFNEERAKMTCTAWPARMTASEAMKPSNYLKQELQSLKYAVMGGATEQYEHGILLYNRLKLSEGCFWLLQSAMEGYPRAILHIGLLYANDRKSKQFLKRKQILNMLLSLIENQTIRIKSRYYHVSSEKMAEYRKLSEELYNGIEKSKRKTILIKESADVIKESATEIASNIIEGNTRYLSRDVACIAKLVLDMLTQKRRKRIFNPDNSGKTENTTISENAKQLVSNYIRDSGFSKDIGELSKKFMLIKELFEVSSSTWEELLLAFNLPSQQVYIENMACFSKKTAQIENEFPTLLNEINILTEGNLSREDSFLKNMLTYRKTFGDENVNQILKKIEEHNNDLTRAKTFIKSISKFIEDSVKNMGYAAVVNSHDSAVKAMNSKILSQEEKRQIYDCQLKILSNYIKHNQTEDSDYDQVSIVQGLRCDIEKSYKNEVESYVKLSELEKEFNKIKKDPFIESFDADLNGLVKDTLKKIKDSDRELEEICTKLESNTLSKSEKIELTRKKTFLEGDIENLKGMLTAMQVFANTRALKRGKAKSSGNNECCIQTIEHELKKNKLKNVCQNEIMVNPVIRNELLHNKKIFERQLKNTASVPLKNKKTEFSNTSIKIVTQTKGSKKELLTSDIKPIKSSAPLVEVEALNTVLKPHSKGKKSIKFIANIGSSFHSSKNKNQNRLNPSKKSLEEKRNPKTACEDKIIVNDTASVPLKNKKTEASNTSIKIVTQTKSSKKELSTFDIKPIKSSDPLVEVKALNTVQQNKISNSPSKGKESIKSTANTHYCFYTHENNNQNRTNPSENPPQEKEDFEEKRYKLELFFQAKKS